jgi:arginyl-tRNA synthetase
MSYFEQVVESLGSHFDSYIYESEAGVEGKKIVLENTPKVFTESEGAIVYVPTEESKLHTAVFINSQGNPTYEAKDIGLLDLKFKKYNPDISVFTTDGQQVSHFQVVLDAAAKINKDWSEKSLHRYHGRMSFKGTKMSSRLGNTPLVEDMLAAVIEEVKIKSPETDEKTAMQISIAAIKFAILRTQAGKDINFDPDTSLSFEGDSGPYLQYTAVRAGALLEKGKSLDIVPSLENPVVGTEILERLIARLPEVVSRAQIEWAPHYIVTYLLELAQAFNSWYGQGKIIDEDVSNTAYRLSVVLAARQSLTNGLWVLGIEVPDRM